MRNYEKEFSERVRFIRETVAQADSDGVVFGNSGGKDSALVGILAKAACKKTIGVIMPCTSRRNYEEDASDAAQLAQQYEIETRTIDLSPVKNAELEALQKNVQLSAAAVANIAPRLRMTTLYAIAASENCLVAGTGNRSEAYVGYFTKWGDGAYDFNPISDLTVTEVYEFLRFLDAPKRILDKAPSAALFDGQTDEKEMGVSYATLDSFILGGNVDLDAQRQIERMHKRSLHKLESPKRFA